jgi:hypothetical protein
MFRTIPHYKILQKAVQLFVVVMCARAERPISAGATQDANDVRIKLTLRRVRVTIVAVGKQSSFHILNVCL